MPVQTIPLDFSGGVNLLRDPRRILPNQVTYAKNLFPKRSGMLSTRGVAQYAYHYIDAGLGAVNQPTNFAFSPDTDLRYAYTFMADSTTHYFSAGNGHTPSYAESWTQEPNSHRPVLFPYNREIYCLPGQIVGVREDGKNVIGFVAYGYGSAAIGEVYYSTSQSVDLPPKVMGLYRNRFVLANFGTGYENALVIGDPYNAGAVGPLAVPTDFLSDNGRFLRVGAAGDRIVAVTEITQTEVGTPAQSALLVLCEFSAYVITGEPLASGETPDPVSGYAGDSQVNRVSYDCGCSSAQTVVRTPFGTIWAGPDDVWMFATGSVPVRIGKNMRSALAQTPAHKRWLWHAAYHDGVYRLAVASPGQGPDNYDTMGDQWWLDLRDGPPRSDDEARWWGPQQYRICKAYLDESPVAGTYIMVTDTRVGVQPALYAFHTGIYSGSLEIKGLILTQLDVPGAYDSAMNYMGANGEESETDIARELDNELEFELITAEMDFGDPMVEKLLLGVEINLWNSEVLELDSEILLDGGRAYDTQQLQVDQKGFILGVDGVETRGSREFQSVLLPMDPDSRMLGKTIQFRLYSVAGWPVPAEGINSEVVTRLDTNNDVMTSSITPGFYEEIDDFLDEVMGQINDSHAAVGEATAFDHNQTSPRPAVIIANPSYKWDTIFDAETAGVELDSDTERRNKKVFASLGFDTNQTTIGATDEDHAADVKVRTKLAAEVEIGGIFMRVYTYGGRPRK